MCQSLRASDSRCRRGVATTDTRRDCRPVSPQPSRPLPERIAPSLLRLPRHRRSRCTDPRQDRDGAHIRAIAAAAWRPSPAAWLPSPFLSDQLATITTDATVLSVHAAPSRPPHRTITFKSSFPTSGASLGIEGLRRWRQACPTSSVRSTGAHRPGLATGADHITRACVPRTARTSSTGHADGTTLKANGARTASADYAAHGSVRTLRTRRIGYDRRRALGRINP
jgi:hypothetical protein